jgi:hypothetical protein
VKREKRLTKREQKALKAAQNPAAHEHDHQHQHIHCVACGRHIDPHEFTGGANALATQVRCAHGGVWNACVGCAGRARELLAIHDRTGKPVQAAEAWH